MPVHIRRVRARIRPDEVGDDEQIAVQREHVTPMLSGA